MHALTLRQPWADAVARGWKRVENRTWAPPASVVGNELAIHAAARPDRPRFGIYCAIAGEHARALEAMPYQAVVAVVRVAGALHLPTGRIVGHLSPEQLAHVEGSPWTSGPWAWVLEDVRALASPVRCPGAQNVWPLSDAVAREVATVLDVRHGRG